MTKVPTLERYRVIDSLQIGPVEITPVSVRTPYRVTVDGQLHETTFAYRFNEPVFDPKRSDDRNLAAMMAVQPALNYGLFCKEIIFHDLFDPKDRQFITEMMENTSREILVKKLHEENVFLLPGWALAEIPARNDYTQAELIFKDEESRLEQAFWAGRENGFCVLSSGGKESLLSYGLLSELACDCHPVYINESGRHWFTALNGYRYFKKRIPNTARVWTDCDRLFNWMLRRISFIRPDFQKLRADDYPLRLWTVAVFLFGALPLIRKRGLAHLVVGNEFDTSRYFDDGPLPHYDGLFDQSLWFDSALREYFKRKGWSVRVCSILRNLSESLVEKVLASRYPDLFATQVSCHAALIDGDHVRPCGRCEKCRRIMSILTAMGIDPGLIGYTKVMVDTALKSLSGRGLHSQLAGEFDQVQALLKGATVPQKIEFFRIAEFSAPLREIPDTIRQPLLNLLEPYSKGTLITETSRLSLSARMSGKP